MNIKIVCLLSAIILGTLGFNIKTDRSLKGFDMEKSRKYAAYASLAYCPKKCLQSWTCKSGEKFPKLVNVTHFNNDVTLAAAYIGYEQATGYLYISWRGSANAQNWIQDFNIEMQPFSACKGCYIHVGFHFDYTVNAKKINSYLESITKQKSVQKIVITGHSLGASLASINGLYLSLSGINIPIQVHHFGSPRFANQNLAQFVGMKIPQHYRLVHHRDLIPHLPPEVQYKHAPYEVFFDKDMQNYKICDKSGQDHSCSNQYFPEYNAGDHDFYYMDMDPKC